MKTRRLLLLALVALGVQYIAIAQNDDMYFVPKTKAQKVAEQIFHKTDVILFQNQSDQTRYD